MKYDFKKQLRCFLIEVKSVSGMLSILSSGHTISHSCELYRLYLPGGVSFRGISYS